MWLKEVRHQIDGRSSCGGTSLLLEASWRGGGEREDKSRGGANVLDGGCSVLFPTD